MSRPINIEGLSENELIHLNRQIVERLRLLREMRAHTQMMKFQVGDRVCFEPSDRPTVHGMLTRFNRKTVTVITDDGARWNVAPGFLRRSTLPRPAHFSRDNLIELPDLFEEEP